MLCLSTRLHNLSECRKGLASATKQLRVRRLQYDPLISSHSGDSIIFQLKNQMESLALLHGLTVDEINRTLRRWRNLHANDTSFRLLSILNNIPLQVWNYPLDILLCRRHFFVNEPGEY